MSTPALRDAPVLVIGAGIMGAGIAQVAAQAGHRVFLFDTRAGAATQARVQLQATLDTLVARGKLDADAARAALERIRAVATLEEGADALLVVEAIVEDLAIKRGLLRQLESLVAADCVLATNTSSISITALASGLQHPSRLVGMHFFNPVLVMKLVEVVSGLHTDPAVAAAIFDLAACWGKSPVHARSTPGFIVNRIARPFYAEALALLLERASTPEAIDACLRSAGFRMGPCELIDLIGHDTNFAVTQSVYQATFGDKRYAPSLVQREMVDGGLLGRKSGRGFYDHGTQARKPGLAAVPGASTPPAARALVVRGRGVLASRLATALRQSGVAFDEDVASAWTGLDVDGAQIRVTDGRTASQVSAETEVSNIAVVDLTLPPGATGDALAFSMAAQASTAWQADAAQWLRLGGYVPLRIEDAPGLIVARTLAMLINEAADAVQQGVCTAEGADLAMKLGVNYPAGPFEWLAAWSAREVAGLLDRLDTCYRGERYRVSPFLRQSAWTCA